jgi:hypothetical protein
MNDAVLLLMHQGKSFTADVSQAVRSHGFSLVALSSRPEKAEALESVKPYLEDCIVTEDDQLCAEDLKGIVATFASRGYAVRAVIATFEGYRLMMAALNESIGAPDSSAEPLRLCLNKYDLRRFLFERGLSTVRCHRLLRDNQPRLDPGTWFVKPVRGAGSFAAFILKDLKDLDDLPELQRQMRNDHRMAAIFMNEYDFLVEEYIEGPEFSFETVVVGDAYHVCVQEKARLDRLERTTLESMSISPPTSVNRDVVLAGADFITRCLAEVGVTKGAFHVEAKYWTSKARWEIVEINPRMGGSLINASVKSVTGSSILDLWVDALLAREDADTDELRGRLQRISQLTSLRSGTASRATVFLSKYGMKGRTVQSIAFQPSRKPDIVKMHAEAGTKLEDSDRAICLMDALWEVDCAALSDEVEFLDRDATEHFHVEYC